MQQLDALTRFLCQQSRQDVQWFYLAMLKAGLNLFCRIECMYEGGR